MKRLIMTFNLGKSSQRLRQLLVTARTFALLSLGSMILVLVVGIGVIVHEKTASSPISSMKGFASSVSSGLFSDMLAMEMPGTGEAGKKWSITGKQASTFLLRMLTNINPADPLSLLSSQYPGLGGDSTVILRSGSGTGESIASEDHDTVPPEGDENPSSVVGDSDRPDHPAGDLDTSTGTGDDDADNTSDNTSDNPADDSDSTSLPDSTSTDTPAVPDKGTESDTDNTPSTQEPAKPTTGDRNVVFIYSSHSRESWFPEVNSKKYAESPVKNVTLLGKRLASQLKESGIGSISSGTDYASTVKNYNWLLSYKYSKQTVVSAIAKDKELSYFFDIHRDSLRRKNTTITIDGVTYAQVFLVIGLANPHWSENEALANKIHEALEKKYPGLSRGVLGKTKASGNGEYNQSLSPHSVLIEVGGVDNTLKESYRTIDVLAKVISDIYWDAEKVSASK
ncbi:stage II sporulation protein P [Paenibacillus sp. OV219]|uniref:stage II sporulation protein P n=1 Tax=Paenibacillus sp. OV219 TaxID=1884377 RepID=UPI0008CB8E3E|nr:stage II sporulation protein P [Paenibacillus sp. OV219]SEN07876.1 stage II sporulation protein P [Paenibacillus sp. OV219]